MCRYASRIYCFFHECFERFDNVYNDFLVIETCAYDVDPAAEVDGVDGVDMCFDMCFDMCVDMCVNQQEDTVDACSYSARAASAV